MRYLLGSLIALNASLLYGQADPTRAAIVNNVPGGTVQMPSEGFTAQIGEWKYRGTEVYPSARYEGWGASGIERASAYTDRHLISGDAAYNRAVSASPATGHAVVSTYPVYIDRPVYVGYSYPYRYDAYYVPRRYMVSGGYWVTP